MEEKLKRILIIGGNGSGKTTFSKKLSEKIGIPLIHLDSLYWKDNWTPALNDEFDYLLYQELAKERWILDGNMNRTFLKRLEYCDSVIYFDFSRLICICRAIKRIIKNYGKSRPDMGGYCPERLDFKFLKAVWNFNKKNRQRYYELLKSKKNLKIIILKNNRDVKKMLQSL